MTDSPRELLARELGVEIPENVNWTELSRQLNNATHRQQQAERESAAAMRAAEVRAKHAALVDLVDAAKSDAGPLLRDILEHHAPHDPGRSYGSTTCHGCDGSDYDGEKPDWPCSTWELIETELKAAQ